jgi:hypothetical protein
MERLLKRGRQIAETRAVAVADALAARTLPSGIKAERSDAGVTLSGRGLRRRYVRDSALREAIR